MYEHLALSDNGFLFDTRTGNTYSLNKTGTFLLKALIAGADGAEPSPGDLSAQVSERFEVEEPTARRDVEQFLFRLRDLHLRNDGGGQ